ncbi:MAG: hypothetical protein J5449_08280, partial [Oscillospiraceae bacterium]|nr:hypothetical protein [Oscillospiraceae bacterium]
NRETFIVMLHDAIALLGTYDMTATADITGATDYDKLNPDNIDAIAWSVGVELIKGTSTSTLTIDPTGLVTRAQIAQMLTNYYQHVG